MIPMLDPGFAVRMGPGISSHDPSMYTLSITEWPWGRMLYTDEERHNETKQSRGRLH